MIIAQTVTTIAGTLCYPFDTIRRRIMMQSKINNTSQQLRYNSGFHCLKMIIKDEGIKGLFRGLSVNLFRGVSGSILLVGYDEFNSFFKRIFM
jgi:solute carrier family 25 (adenine nucleotide translocator) protein 4/5/6/31